MTRLGLRFRADPILQRGIRGVFRCNFAAFRACRWGCFCRVVRAGFSEDQMGNAFPSFMAGTRFPSVLQDGLDGAFWAWSILELQLFSEVN